MLSGRPQAPDLESSDNDGIRRQAQGRGRTRSVAGSAQFFQMENLLS